MSRIYEQNMSRIYEHTMGLKIRHEHVSPGLASLYMAAHRVGPSAWRDAVRPILCRCDIFVHRFVRFFESFCWYSLFFLFFLFAVTWCIRNAASVSIDDFYLTYADQVCTSAVVVPFSM